MITQTQLYLLEMIKASLFEVKPDFPSDIKWSDIVAEAKAQTVMGLIGPVIPLKDESSEQSKAMYMRIMYEQDRLIKCFESSDIPCVILKGSASAIYYPKPYLRTMGDIDVLVPRERFCEAKKLLELNKYEYDHGKGHDDLFFDDIRELAYTKNGIIIELHKSFSSPGINIDDILEAAIKRRTYRELNGYKFPMLPSPENGLVLIGHISQHLKNNVLGLRQIIDWEMYINSCDDKDFYANQLLPILKNTGLLTLAAYVTRMCNRHLGLVKEVDFGIDVDDSLTDELMEVLMADGNFGSKVNADKSFDDKKIISATYGIKRYGFFGYFILVGIQTSSFCRKHASVRLFAFVYGFFRQLTSGIKIIVRNKGVGNNLGDGKKMYDLHVKRSELYNKLGVRTGK